MRVLLPTAMLPVLMLVAGVASAQTAAPAPAPAPPPVAGPVVVMVPAARPADVATPEAIVQSLYDVISGPAGQQRDWNRMRSLFVPGGRLMVASPRPDGSVALRVLQVKDYIAGSGEVLVKHGFTERELSRRIERFGHIAHVFSTYEGKTEDGPTIRGINSIQLMQDGQRWWIVSVLWEAESKTLSLPADYLPKAKR